MRRYQGMDFRRTRTQGGTDGTICARRGSNSTPQAAIASKSGHFGVPPEEPHPNHYGLLRDDGAEKPAFEALRRLVERFGARS
jgi:hypothetical protein